MLINKPLPDVGIEEVLIISPVDGFTTLFSDALTKREADSACSDDVAIPNCTDDASRVVVEPWSDAVAVCTFVEKSVGSPNPAIEEDCIIV